MKLMAKRRLAALCTAGILALTATSQAFAADTSKSSAETAFLRVRLDLLSDEGLTGVTEDMITFSDTENWVHEEDGYYYYKDPLEDGESVEFMKAVSIPHAWGDEEDGKSFRVVVTAEVAENMDGTANWGDGSVTTSVSTLDYGNRKVGRKTYSTTELSVDISEYELDANGNRIEYENDKLVVPGTEVDKIVILTVHVGSTSKTSSSGGSSGGSSGSSSSGGSSSSSGGNGGGTEVIPIDDGTGPDPSPINIPGILTGDNSLMVPFAAAAILALILLIVLLVPKKKQRQQ